MSIAYKGWTHEVTGRLTPRQARGYYYRIPLADRLLYGSELEGSGNTGKQDSWDLDEIFKEAEDLKIPTPKDR